MGDERRVKGLNLRGIVVALRAAPVAREVVVAGLPDDAVPFFGDTRVMATSWYPLPVFLAVLERWHALCFGGSERGAIQMGSVGALHNARTAHGAAVKTSASSTLEGFTRAWRQNFDFGRLDVTLAPRRARVTFVDYDDVGMVHGMLHVGWFKGLVELSGAKNVSAQALTRPWANRGRLVIELAWDEG